MAGHFDGTTVIKGTDDDLSDAIVMANPHPVPHQGRRNQVVTMFEGEAWGLRPAAARIAIGALGDTGGNLLRG